MNIVIVTSVVHTKEQSIFPPSERLQQLSNTIDSIHQHIPHPFIVVLEGSETEVYNSSIKSLQIDEFHHNINIHNYPKSHGEILLLFHYFESPAFQKLKSSPTQFLTINKISGRYYFAPCFTFDTTHLSKIRVHNTWSGKGITETRYYRFPFQYCDEFMHKLSQIIQQGIYIDLEHTFYQIQVIPHGSIDEIHIKGIEAPTGKEIYD